MLWNDFSKRRMLAKSRCVTVNTTGLGRGKNDVPNNDRIDCDEEHEENGMQVGMLLYKIHWKSDPDFHPTLAAIANARSQAKKTQARQVPTLAAVIDAEGTLLW